MSWCQILLNTSDAAQLMVVTSIACNLLLEFSPSKEVSSNYLCFQLQLMSVDGDDDDETDDWQVHK